jgi:cytochrome c
VDVSPDGTGLPAGSGDVWTGEELFVENCAACHGDFAEGVGNWPVLAGGFGTLADEDPVKTVGSYWPYLSTVWDYTHRSMPFGNAGTLSADETYAIVAYILYSNNLVDDDFVLSHENFTDVELPNADGFVIDDRAELEYAQWSSEPCMSDCKENVEITMRATFLDVTPEEEGTEEAVVEEAAAEVEETTEAAPAADAGQAALDPALVEAGEAAFRQCSACHQVGANARNGTGPHLNGVFGRTLGAVDGFRYSSVFADANAAGEVWDAENMAAFLADPRASRRGTRMAFRGVSDPAEIDALIAYLQSLDAE